MPVLSTLIESHNIAGNRGNSVISWKTGRFFHEMNCRSPPTKPARSSHDGGPVENVVIVETVTMQALGEIGLDGVTTTINRFNLLNRLPPPEKTGGLTPPPS